MKNTWCYLLGAFVLLIPTGPDTFQYSAEHYVG